jgi:hypothetical protein
MLLDPAFGTITKQIIRDFGLRLFGMILITFINNKYSLYRYGTGKAW